MDDCLSEERENAEWNPLIRICRCTGHLSAGDFFFIAVRKIRKPGVSANDYSPLYWTLRSSALEIALLQLFLCWNSATRCCQYQSCNSVILLSATFGSEETPHLEVRTSLHDFYPSFKGFLIEAIGNGPLRDRPISTYRLFRLSPWCLVNRSKQIRLKQKWNKIE